MHKPSFGVRKGSLDEPLDGDRGRNHAYAKPDHNHYACEFAGAIRGNSTKSKSEFEQPDLRFFNGLS
jgi:hypothetical protein